jgi:hypothetical protein
LKLVGAVATSTTPRRTMEPAISPLLDLTGVWASRPDESVIPPEPILFNSPDLLTGPEVGTWAAPLATSPTAQKDGVGLVDQEEAMGLLPLGLLDSHRIHLQPKSAPSL